MIKRCLAVLMLCLIALTSAQAAKLCRRYACITQKNIHTIALSNRQFSHHQWNVLLKAIRGNRQLSRLVFSNINITPSQQKDLIDLLSHKKLISFTLSNTVLLPDKLSELIIALSNSQIQHVNLIDVDIKNSDMTILSEYLSRNQHLKKLSLAHNFLTDKSIILLTQGLLDNQSLLELDLSQNHIKDAGAEAIATYINRNPKLSHLNLAGNPIQNQGRYALKQALRNNHQLTTLYISRNSPYRPKPYDLIDKKSSQPQAIGLGYCGIGPALPRCPRAQVHCKPIKKTASNPCGWLTFSCYAKNKCPKGYAPM